MNTKLILVFLLLCVASGHAAGQPNIQSLIGREFSIHDDFAGQELAFKLNGESLSAVWRVLGSGRPILSEVQYPVEVRSANQCVFEAELRDRSRSRVKIEIGRRSEVRAYVNGVRIYIEERN